MSKFEDFTNDFKIIFRCPFCENKSRDGELRILKEGNFHHLLYFRCRSCRGSLITLITIKSDGISSIGFLTDLSLKDFIKFEKKSAIKIDEVLDFHLLLKKEENILELLNS